MRNKKVIKMVQLAILIAITLLMAFTPIGYIRTGGLAIQMIMIPVTVGAMILGPGAGALLGLVFGLTSFWQCFGLDPFGAQLLSINPFFTFLLCVPTRTLVGFLTGVLFNGIKKIDKSNTISYFAGGLLGAMLNTAIFMSSLMLLFYNTDYIQSFNTSGKNIIAFIISFVALNGFLEWPVTSIAGGIVSKAVSRFLRKTEIE